MPVPQPGQTDFTTEEGPGGTADSRPRCGLSPGRRSSRSARAGWPRRPPRPPASARHGRPPAAMAEVEEADIYKVDQNRLFYLNTYRGFVIYDVNDPKNPQRLARLPVFGYPVEMFVGGQHGLRPAARRPLPDPGGRQAAVRAPQRLAAGDHRHRRPAQPQAAQHHRHRRPAARGRLAQDREHHLRRLLRPRSPTTGAGGPIPASRRSRPGSTRSTSPTPRTRCKAGELQDLRGRQRHHQRHPGRTTTTGSFESVAISATSNALMVVENWNVSTPRRGAAGGGPAAAGCGSYNSNQFAARLAHRHQRPQRQDPAARAASRPGAA